MAVELCFTENGVETCFLVGSDGAGSSTGGWQFDTADFQTGDGTAQILTITGIDEAGNVSVPIVFEYIVDATGPEISADQHLDEVDGAEYKPGAPTGDPVLSGTVVDGTGVDTIIIRLLLPDGTVVTQDVSLTGGDCEYIAELTMNGLYIMTVEAVDQAGNAASHGSFNLLVEGAVGNSPPVVDAGENQTVLVGEKVELDPATFTDPDAADTHSATVNWGDGIVIPGDVVRAANIVESSHVYDSPGIYTVTVTVEDDGGLSSSDSFSVQVLQQNHSKVLMPIIIKS